MKVVLIIFLKMFRFRSTQTGNLALQAETAGAKTTFLNLLLGKYEYQGTISTSVNFEYFPFDVPDPSQNTLQIAKNIAGNVPLWELKRELLILQLSEDVLDRPFCTLSCGEQTKVLLASLFLKENRFLLIDEPTNHLDMNARKLISRYLNDKRGFILVSHDRAFLDSCIDHILSINRTNIEIQKGSFSSWHHNKQLQDNYELSENERLKKDMIRLQSAAKRTTAWSDKVEKTKYDTLNSGLRPDRGYIGHRAAKMMKRAKGIEARRETATEEKSKLLKNIESAEKLNLKPIPYFTDRLCSLRDVSIHYGENTVCENIDFTIRQNDRIALCGRNGSGKI